LEIYKFNPLIYTNLSFIYFQTGDFESSLNISREALTHIPNNIEPYENIGKTFYGMGLKDSSIVYFEKAHQLFPNHPNTIDALARLYTEKKDPRANYFMQLLNQMQSQNR
jgi:tetratricopeptide (TPR) repeat protein